MRLRKLSKLRLNAGRRRTRKRFTLKRKGVAHVATSFFIYNKVMDKVFSRKAILLNILILVASISMFPLIQLFGNGDIFWIYVLVLFVLSTYSASVYFQKMKRINNVPVAGAMPGANPVSVSGDGALQMTQQPNRKLALLQSLALASGVIEAISIVTTIILFSNPQPVSIIAIITVPTCVINGVILLVLILACSIQKNKNGAAINKSTGSKKNGTF